MILPQMKIMINPLNTLRIVGFILIFIFCSPYKIGIAQTAENDTMNNQLELTEGETYFEIFSFKNDLEKFWPKRGLKTIFHHAVSIHWINKEEYAEFFKSKKKELQIKFEVIEREFWKVPNQNRWNNIYHCKIVELTFNDGQKIE